jgi:hypothetical protein
VDISTLLYEANRADPGFPTVLRARIDGFTICRLDCLQLQDVIHPAEFRLAADPLLVHAPPLSSPLLDMVIDSGDDYLCELRDCAIY